MNAYEMERLELEAKAKGLSVWELEMMKATPDSLMGDLRDDLRRSPANGFTAPPVGEQKVRIIPIPDDICEVIVMSGNIPHLTPGHVIRVIQTELRKGTG